MPCISANNTTFALLVRCQVYSSVCASPVFEAFNMPQNNTNSYSTCASYTFTGAKQTQKQQQMWIYILSSDKLKPTLLSVINNVFQLQGRQTVLKGGE